MNEFDLNQYVTERVGMFFNGHGISLTYIDQGMPSHCQSSPYGSVIIINNKEVGYFADKLGINYESMHIAVRCHEIGHAVSFFLGEQSVNELAEEYNACHHAMTTVSQGLPLSWVGIPETVHTAAVFMSIRSRTNPEDLSEVLRRGSLERFYVVNDSIKDMGDLNQMRNTKIETK